MKQLSCKELGGACDTLIQGENFDELGKNCQTHVMEAVKSGDQAHIEAMKGMQAATPVEQQAMIEEFRVRFKKAPHV